MYFTSPILGIWFLPEIFVSGIPKITPIHYNIRQELFDYAGRTTPNAIAALKVCCVTLSQNDKNK